MHMGCVHPFFFDRTHQHFAHNRHIARVSMAVFRDSVVALVLVVSQCQCSLLVFWTHCVAQTARLSVGQEKERFHIFGPLDHRSIRPCLCPCHCLFPAGAGREGQSPRRDSQALCQTSTGLSCVFVSYPHPLNCVIAFASCLIPFAMSPKRRTEKALPRRFQSVASAARSMGCGITTGVVSTGRFRRGVSAVTNWWDCPTTQSGDDTANTEYRLKLCKSWGFATTLLGVFTDDRRSCFVRCH